jgi:hypothetical protein
VDYYISVVCCEKDTNVYRYIQKMNKREMGEDYELSEMDFKIRNFGTRRVKKLPQPFQVAFEIATDISGRFKW